MEVPFFQGMSIDQLKALASVCEQEHYPEGARIFEQGEVSGALYLVVNGQVGIEQEKRKGVFTPLTLFEAHSCLGETELFNNHLRTCSAFAIRDTLMLRLRREPVLELARQSPDLSLELINVLSVRLREANNSIAELTRAHSQELHKVYDQLI
jgi:CRP/FNR family transcriptional regulator